MAVPKLCEEPVTVNPAAVTPVPVSVPPSDGVKVSPFVATDHVAESLPAAVGVNTNAISQESPAPTELPQFVCEAKLLEPDSVRANGNAVPELFVSLVV